MGFAPNILRNAIGLAFGLGTLAACSHQMLHAERASAAPEPLAERSLPVQTLAQASRTPVEQPVHMIAANEPAAIITNEAAQVENTAPFSAERIRALALQPQTLPEEGNLSSTGLTIHVYDPVARLESRNSEAGRRARLQGVVGQSPFADTAGMEVDYSRDFVAKSAVGGLDVAAGPRASLAVGPEGSATRLGAIVKIGENLHEPRAQQGRWYLFVGGGAEALTYAPDGGHTLMDGLRLEDQTIVGDGQAGVAMRVGRANLSLAYIRRETDVYSRVHDLNADNVEDFAGLSVAWRR